MGTLFIHSSMQQVVVSNQPSLVSVSGTLQTILGSVCDLVTVYELVAKVDDNSDLTALLGQTIQDSCSWVSGIINSYTLSLHTPVTFHCCILKHTKSPCVLSFTAQLPCHQQC